MKNSYTNPKLFPSDRGLNKLWFVAFRYTNPETGERKQFQFRGDINRQNSKLNRIREGNSLSNALLRMLQEGWNPFTDETEKEQDRIPLYELLDNMLEIKKSSLKPKSYRTYSDAKNILQAWMLKKHLKIMMPRAFTSRHARQFADYLLTAKKYQGKTFNGMMSFIKVFFNMMIAREIIEKNPFEKIEKMPHDIGKNHAFTQQEKTLLINRFKQMDRPLFHYVSFMYHCFIRRTELIQIQVGDVDLKNQSIRILSKVSKNRKQESVSIPEGLIPIIEEMRLYEYPAHYYLFGPRLKPGPNRYAKADSITYRHKKHLKALEIPDTKTLYSWKHTGVCDYWEVLKDPYVLMRQLRHYDLSVTMVYLKSLGMTPNEKISSARICL